MQNYPQWGEALSKNIVNAPEYIHKVQPHQKEEKENHQNRHWKVYYGTHVVSRFEQENILLC